MALKVQKTPTFQLGSGEQFSVAQTPQSKPVIQTLAREEQFFRGNKKNFNMTSQNSQIHGRKVDSPKIFVKEDTNEIRPKTSAQINRKVGSGLNSQKVKSQKQTKKVDNRKIESTNLATQRAQEQPLLQTPQSTEVQIKNTSNLLNGALSKYQQARQSCQAENASDSKNKVISSTKAQKKRSRQSNIQQNTDPIVQTQLQVSSPTIASKTPKPKPVKQQKTARQDNKPLKSRRNHSTDATSKPSLANTQKLKCRKPRLNQTITSGLAVLSAVNSTTKATQKQGNTPSLRTRGGNKNSNHFSFELDNKENMTNNRRPFSDQGRSIRHGGGRESLQNDMSITSSLSSQKGEKNIGKKQKQNYFIDGEQLLRQLSPGTPNRSEDHIKSLMSSQINNSLQRRDDKKKQMVQKGGKFQKLEKQQAQDLLKKFFAEEQKKIERERLREDQRKAQEEAEKLKYKKKRSRSCVSKVEHQFLVARVEKQRDKSNEIQNETGLEVVKKSNNYVLELTQLKKEIFQEIRRDLKDGLISPDALSGGVSNKNRSKIRDKTQTSSTPNYTSLRQGDQTLIEKQTKRKEAGKKSCPEMSNSKIRRYIDRQKRKILAQKNLEQTIVHEKALRIRQTLIDLQNFSRTGERQQRQLNVRQPVNIAVKSKTTKNSENQIVNQVRISAPTHNIKAIKSHDSFDSGRLKSEERVPSQTDQIINIFQLNSSGSTNKRQSSKGKQRKVEEDIPLKELKPQKIGHKKRRQPEKKLDNFSSLDSKTGQVNLTKGITDSDFESLDPCTKPKKSADKFEKSAIEQRKQEPSKDQILKAVITIQKWYRNQTTQKFDESSDSILHSGPTNVNTAQSIRKNSAVPQLNLEKINSSDVNQNYQQVTKPKEQSSARSTSIFDRDTFQEQFKVSNLIKPKEDVDMPQLKKKREMEALEIESKQRQQQLQQEFDQKKFSPRTFEHKKQMLDRWVSMKKEEVKTNAKRAAESELENSKKIIDSTNTDYLQVKQIIMNSGRSSSHRHSGRDEIIHGPISSVRTDQLNSQRIDSKRNSQRAQPSLMELINNTNNKVMNIESSSHSRNQSSKREGDQSDASQTQSQISKMNFEDYDEDTDKFQDVYVRTNGAGWEKVKKSDEIENSLKAESTLKRVDSLKNLGEKSLVKNVARTNLQDEDSESDVAKQIRNISPQNSSSSESRKDQIKGLRSDNFFMNKMDLGNSPKNEESNIRIEIAGETQHINQGAQFTQIGPVSPLSGASSDLGIQRGSMSLESSASGENQQILQQTLKDLGKEQELNKKVDQLTDELLKAILVELSQDFPKLISRTELTLEEPVQIQGIKTDLYAIEKYIDEIVEEIKNVVNAEEFLKVLNVPLTRDFIQILYQLQNSDIGSCEHFEENYPQILPLELYLTLEKRRKEAREKMLLEMKEKPKNSQAEMIKILLAECEHIHNKVLFDCINDSLLQFKPYGKEGAPSPWSRKNRRLKPTDDFTLNEIFEIVKHDLFRWAITNAGTLPRREFVYRGVFDEELFTEIREKKLVSLLAREMIENEPKWLNYEFEHAQVKIDIGDMILEQLVKECIDVLNLQQPVEEDDQLRQKILDDLQSKPASGDGRAVPADKSKYSDFSNNNDDDDWNL